MVKVVDRALCTGPYALIHHFQSKRAADQISIRRWVLLFTCCNLCKYSALNFHIASYFLIANGDFEAWLHSWNAHCWKHDVTSRRYLFTTVMGVGENSRHLMHDEICLGVMVRGKFSHKSSTKITCISAVRAATYPVFPPGIVGVNGMQQFSQQRSR
ncbi:hypothetical protein GOBAR_DD36448 [Gossypium barbadense]|nr:hypothetical protein GOBAR_DD36448 [Gossypium barbadense]